MTDKPIPPSPPEGAGDLETQGIEMLVHTFHSSADPTLRRYAVYLLGKSGDPVALRPLVEALADPDKIVREQAMRWRRFSQRLSGPWRLSRIRLHTNGDSRIPEL